MSLARTALAQLSTSSRIMASSVVVFIFLFFKVPFTGRVRKRPNMRISRQFRRLSRVLASKSDFLSFLRNRPPTREFSFLYLAHPAKPPSCTTILVAESQDLKPQMQSVLSGRAVMQRRF